MFDDQQPKNPAPPANLPSEPMDMFSETDNSAVPPAIPNALGAGLLKKKGEGGTQVIPATPDAAPVYSMKEPVLGKILLIVLVVVAVGGLGYGGYRFYQKYFSSQNTIVENPAKEAVKKVIGEDVATEPVSEIIIPAEPPMVVSTNTAATVEEKSVSTTDVSAQMNNDKILFGEPVDVDQDGLDDVRERELGTNLKLSDTDIDCLNDYQEVVVFKTNPLNSDSDGDSYIDGEEVANGYNPLGPGKLSSYPTSFSTSTFATIKNCVATKKGTIKK